MQHTPFDTVTDVSVEVNEVIKKLNEVQDLEHYKTILSEGEQGSISAIITSLVSKRDMINKVREQLQKV